MLIFKHNFSPHKSVIWNNKYITFKNKSLFDRNGYNTGIILVRQLFKNNGNIFNYCEFLNYYKIPINAKEFAVVFDAIPSGLIQLLSGNISSESIPLYTIQLSINGVKVIYNKCNNLYIKKLCRTTLFPKCKPFWNSLYDQIEWKEVWKLPSKYCLTNKVKQVTYKVIHFIFTVKQVLLKIFETWRPHVSFVTWRKNTIYTNKNGLTINLAL